MSEKERRETEDIMLLFYNTVFHKGLNQLNTHAPSQSLGVGIKNIQQRMKDLSTPA